MYTRAASQSGDPTLVMTLCICIRWLSLAHARNIDAVPIFRPAQCNPILMSGDNQRTLTAPNRLPPMSKWKLLTVSRTKRAIVYSYRIQPSV